MIKQIMIMLLVFQMAGLVHANCRAAAEPEFPDPETALHIDMLKAQDAVKLYIAKQETYLSCIDNAIQYNRVVEEMHRVADKFNSLARRYKVRRESLGMYTDLALISVKYQQ